MQKNDKTAKRKAKLRARKTQAVRDQQSQSNRVANAIMELCAPILPEYIDDSNTLDIVGRGIVWRMGMIAWNIAVTGRTEIGDTEIQQMHLGVEEQKIIKAEIDGLVRRKYAQFPRLQTAILKISIEHSSNTIKPKIRLGEAFPQPRIPDLNSSVDSTSTTRHEALPIKHLFYDVKLRQKVMATVTDFVSYEDGKNKRYAFKATTVDGRSLTAFVSKDDWLKATNTQK